MITALTLAATLVALPAQEVDSARFLAAVREVAGTAGTASPLGPYDLTKAVWQQHAPSTPYSYARDEGYALLVATRHVQWLTAQLRRAGMPVTAYALGACWRLGLTGGKKALNRGDQVRYADSVHNLYFEKKH